MPSNLTGAPKPVYLSKKDEQGNVIREVPLQFKALTDKDIDELDEWIRAEFLVAIRKSMRLDASLTQEERMSEMSMAQETASSLSWMSAKGARMMACPKGLARLIWQHCKDCCETFEDLREMMFDPDNIMLVNEAIKYVNQSDYKSERLQKLAKEAQAPGKPNRKKRRAQDNLKRKQKKKKKRK